MSRFDALDDGSSHDGRDSIGSFRKRPTAYGAPKGHSGQEGNTTRDHSIWKGQKPMGSSNTHNGPGQRSRFDAEGNGSSHNGRDSLGSFQKKPIMPGAHKSLTGPAGPGSINQVGQSSAYPIDQRGQPSGGQNLIDKTNTGAPYQGQNSLNSNDPTKGAPALGDKAGVNGIGVEPGAKDNTLEKGHYGPEILGNYGFEYDDYYSDEYKIPTNGYSNDKSYYQSGGRRSQYNSYYNNMSYPSNYNYNYPTNTNHVGVHPNQQSYQSPCQIGVIPMRSAAFQAPRIPLPKLCNHLLPGNDDVDEDEDGVAFQFKPQTSCRTEVTFTIEPKPQPPWLTMLNCGFKPMVNCSAPPCYLSPNGNPGMDYIGGTQSFVNRAFGNQVTYGGMANFPTLEQFKKAFPGGRIIAMDDDRQYSNESSESESSSESEEGSSEENEKKQRSASDRYPQDQQPKRLSNQSPHQENRASHQTNRPSQQVNRDSIQSHHHQRNSDSTLSNDGSNYSNLSRSDDWH